MSCELHFHAPIRRYGWASSALCHFAAQHILRLGQARAQAAAVDVRNSLGLLSSIRHPLQPRHHAAAAYTVQPARRPLLQASDHEQLFTPVAEASDWRPRAMATLLAELPLQAILEPLRAPSTPSFALGTAVWQAHESV